MYCGIIRNYAKAIFRIAIQHKTLHEVYSGLSLFADIAKKNLSFGDILCDRSTVQSAKFRLLDSIFLDIKKNFNWHQPTVIATLKVMVRKHHFEFLREIVSQIRTMILRYEKITSVEVILAKSTDGGDKLSLSRDFEKILDMQIDLSLTIKERILGGIIVIIGSKMCDISLRTKLDELASFVKKSYTLLNVRSNLEKQSSN